MPTSDPYSRYPFQSIAIGSLWISLKPWFTFTHFTFALYSYLPSFIPIINHVLLVFIAGKLDWRFHWESAHLMSMIPGTYCGFSVKSVRNIALLGRTLITHSTVSLTHQGKFIDILSGCPQGSEISLSLILFTSMPSRALTCCQRCPKIQHTLLTWGTY